VRFALRAVLKQSFEDGSQIRLVQGTGLISGRFGKPPSSRRAVYAIENLVLFDALVLQQFLIETTDHALKDVRIPKLLGREVLERGPKCSQKNTAADVDLKEVLIGIEEHAFVEIIRVQDQVGLRSQGVYAFDEMPEDPVQLNRGEHSFCFDAPSRVDCAIVLVN
jgi:hypothetical protein